MEAKSLPKPKRILTEEQLGNKRRIDKLKHRENRAENKTRLENIERDVSLLRQTINELAVHLRQLTTSDAAHHHHHHHHHQPPSSYHDGTQHPLHGLSGQLPCPPPAPKSDPWRVSANPTTPLPSAAADPASPGGQAEPFYDHLMERLYAHQAFPQQPLEAQMDMEALLAEIRGDGPVVECRCGKQHSAEVQCTERIAVIMAVELGGMAGSCGITAPRDPALTDMLLQHTDSSHPLAVILSSILRQYDITDVDALCGVFLLSYRLLRWRFYPSPETMADVPAIMRPTQAQITIPHPKSLDFIPFPALRNYLCLNQHRDARHSVDLYLRSMRLVLPPGKTLMTKTERGGVELNPEFEIFASDLRNWSMGSPWWENFPHLRQFLY